MPSARQFENRLRALPPVRWALRRKRARDADVYLLSFPKVGRTWLRVMIGQLLAAHFGHAELAHGELDDESRRFAAVPRIRVKHDGAPHRCTPQEIDGNKGEYAETRVILMVRDLRDATVSNYFQVTRREHSFHGDLQAWLVEPRGSVDSMLRYYAVWAAQRHVPRDFLLVRYEDLHREPARELRRVARLLGLDGVADATIETAVDNATFERMRSREASRPADGTRFAAGRAEDPESFKSRRGKVGGYAEYLTAAQAEWLERRMRDELDPYYGYSEQESGVRG